MEKIVLYGAGNYCLLLLRGTQLKKYEVIKVVDGDTLKAGTILEGYTVGKPEEISDTIYDKVMITARARRGIAEKLVGELRVPEDKILYFDFEDNLVHQLSDDKLILHRGTEVAVEQALLQNMAVSTIYDGLLYEAFQNCEFEDFDEIMVIGQEEHYWIVKKFFACVKEKKYKVGHFAFDGQVKKNVKYILTERSYLEDLVRLRQDSGFYEQQGLILPLFDVEDTVII